MAVNMQQAQIVADGLKAGNRVWFVEGFFHYFQGFTIFPVLRSEVEMRMREGTLSRQIDRQTALDLKDSEFCQNREAVELILSML